MESVDNDLMFNCDIPKLARWNMKFRRWKNVKYFLFIYLNLLLRCSLSQTVLRKSIPRSALLLLSIMREIFQKIFGLVQRDAAIISVLQSNDDHGWNEFYLRRNRIMKNCRCFNTQTLQCRTSRSVGKQPAVVVRVRCVSDTVPIGTLSLHWHVDDFDCTWCFESR